MARKVQITKEIILQSALNLLIREGYDAVNIKTLATEIGCSTQPIVWHFENMEGLRNALSHYAREYANGLMYAVSPNAEETFEHVGREYVRLALQKPNLFRFLYLLGSQDSKQGFQVIMSSENGQQITKSISGQLGLTMEQASRFIRNTVIYAHGIASLVATNVITTSEDEMMQMINEAAESFLEKEKKL